MQKVAEYKDMEKVKNSIVKIAEDLQRYGESKAMIWRKES